MKVLREIFQTLFFISEETVVGLGAGTLLHLQDTDPQKGTRILFPYQWAMRIATVLWFA